MNLPQIQNVRRNLLHSVAVLNPWEPPIRSWSRGAIRGPWRSPRSIRGHRFGATLGILPAKGSTSGTTATPLVSLRGVGEPSTG